MRSDDDLGMLRQTAHFQCVADQSEDAARTAWDARFWEVIEQLKEQS